MTDKDIERGLVMRLIAVWNIQTNVWKRRSIGAETNSKSTERSVTMFYRVHYSLLQIYVRKLESYFKCFMDINTLDRVTIANIL